MRKAICALLVLVAAVLTACGGGSPTEPESKEVIKLSSKYLGSAQDNTGSGTMTWYVTQSGTKITGSFEARDKASGKTMNGTLSGTITANGTLEFTVKVPKGGISGAANCSVDISGVATTVTISQLVGTYSGANSCTGSFGNGKFNMSN